MVLADDGAFAKQAIAAAKRRAKAQAAATNTDKWVKNLSRARRIAEKTPRARAECRCYQKKLTIDELKGLVLTDLHVGQGSIPRQQG